MTGILTYAVAVLAAALGFASLVTFGVFLWTGGFAVVDLAMEPSSALAWDAALCLAFFLQHSGMVRRSFRAWLSGVLPGWCHGAFYTIISGVLLLLLAVLWQPSESLLALQGPARWLVRGVCLAALAGTGWGMAALGNFDAFGVQALQAHARGKPLRPIPLTIRGPYRHVRHPFYAFGIVAVWANPTLSGDRVLFDVLFTVWMVIGATLEERDLVAEFGDAYRDYQRDVPMLLPALRHR